MRLDDSTLHDLSVELKDLIKDFLAMPHDQTELMKFLKRFSQDEQNLLLQQFDRFGVNIEYEKTGLRSDNKDISAIKFGYKTADAASAGCDTNSLEYHIRCSNIGIEKKIDFWASLVTYPSTKNLMSTFRLIFGKKIFNTSISDMGIYDKTKKLKGIMNTVSENGFTSKAINSLQEIFEGEPERLINAVLKKFDTSDTTVDFLGIRSVSYNGKINFISISKEGIQCNFKYNIMVLPKTAELIETWKLAKEEPKDKE